MIQFAEYGGEGFVFQTDTFAYRNAKYVVQMHGPLAMFAEHWAWPESGSRCTASAASWRRRRCSTPTDCWRPAGTPPTTAAARTASTRWPPTSSTAASTSTASRRARGRGRLRAANPVHRQPVRRQGRDGSPPRHRPTEIAIPEAQTPRDRQGRRNPVRCADRLVAEHDLSANFDIPGFVKHEDLPAHYGWCDVFAAPAL